MDLKFVPDLAASEECKTHDLGEKRLFKTENLNGQTII